jgi:exodeoxyribonuclease V alpha subunit
MNTTAPERSAPTAQLSGVIERVTFFNEESGFCVLRIKAPGHREEVTVIGSLPSVSAGEWLSGEGWWVRDSISNALRCCAATFIELCCK